MVNSKSSSSSYEKSLPNFIIGGAMKCGTTSLHNILSSRGDVFIPSEEIHFFFIGDMIQHAGTVKFDPARTRFTLSQGKLDWYKSFFEKGLGCLIGEDSTSYLSSRVAPKRINEVLPNVNIIFMLRNPTDRTYSHYLHLIKTGRATMSFGQQLIHGDSTLHLRSFYKPQLERYFRTFSRDQIKVVLFERFVEETETVVEEVCSFLGLSGSVDLGSTESHSNRSWYPTFPKAYLALNYAIKGKVDRYRSHWPGKPSEEHTMDTNAPDIGLGERLFKSLVFRLRRAIPKQKSYPPMEDSLRERLTELYARKNRGIGELIGADVGKYWPFE